MVGRDEVQVVHPAFHEAQCNVVKFLGGDHAAIAMPIGNLPVLAKETVAGAASKKDGAGAAGTGEAWFFAHVRPPRGNPQLRRLATDPDFTPKAVNTTLSRT